MTAGQRAMPSSVIREEAVEWRQLHESAAGGELFAILDACDQPLVLYKVLELGDERAASLYRGMEEEKYASFAPYLVLVDGALLDWIQGELWREPWGILAVYDGSLEDLRRHFRRFLIATGPEGADMYFRYYDPRVLRTFLPTCTEGEITEFFGYVRAFIIGGAAVGGEPRSFSRPATGD